MSGTTITAGNREPMRFGCGKSSLGDVLVAMTDKGISAILFGDARDALLRELGNRFPMASLIEATAMLEPLLAEVVSLVEMPGRAIDLPLDPRGSEFQLRVWRSVCEIPAGATASYREIADRIGASNSMRAVAQACAANALAVAIPCHRVVHADGTLGGYRWGAACKQILLDREAA
jgi:AraC family transcriptional regulator, regulatory protein of adaptative response / methylated-DNA-[protein]-cysteine methyltransferase